MQPSSLTSRPAVLSFLLIQVVISSAAVLLRFVARWMKRTSLWWDDWLMIPALFFFWAYVAAGVRVAVSNLSKPVLKLNADEYKSLVQVSYVLVVFLNMTITLARLSVVMLYYRIFSISSRFKIALWIMGITSVIWCIVLDAVVIFQCNPVNALQDPRKGHLCLNSQLIFLISEVFNCLLDIILVAMPIPLIRNLYLPLKDRIAISVLFLLGGFVAVTSLLRIVYTYSANTRLYSVRDAQFWLSLQLSSAIVCACVPAWRPFLRMGRIRKAITSVHLPNSLERSEESRDFGLIPPLQQEDSNNEDWSHRYADTSNNDTYTTRVLAGSVCTDSDNQSQSSTNKIHVKHEVTVT